MKPLLCLPVLVILSACVVSDPVRTELSDSGVTPPARWQVDAQASGEVGVQWLAEFDDARLNALVAESVLGNFDLRAAQARVRAARARARLAGAAQVPRLDVGGGASRRSAATSGTRNTSNSVDATLSASWEVDLWNRLADTTRAATLEALGREADYAAARLSLAASVARTWFDLAEASAQVALAEKSVANFGDNLAVVEDGFRAGLNNALDVHLERSNLANAQSRLQARRIEQDAAARALEVILGRYPGGQVRAPATLPRLNAAVPAGLPAELLNRRPDLQAASLRLAASDARLAAALKNRLPDFTLTTSGGLSSTALSGLLDFNALLLSIAAQLTAPLLRGGQLDAERDLARAEGMEALAVYAQAVLIAFEEVERALRAETLLSQQELALESAVIEARAAEELALERYRSGLTDTITWLEARRRAFDSSSSLLSVSNQRLQNRISLHLALGGDFAATADRAGPQSTDLPSTTGEQASQ